MQHDYSEPILNGLHKPRSIIHDVVFINILSAALPGMSIHSMIANFLSERKSFLPVRLATCTAQGESENRVCFSPLGTFDDCAFLPDWFKKECRG